MTLKLMTIHNRAVSTFNPFFIQNPNLISQKFISADSNSKKSCQGCDLPSDDVPDSTSNSRGQNNNTPSATNNNQSNINERTNGAISRTTPNSTIDLGTTQNTQNLMNSTSISNADSSIPSTGSLDEEEETPVKIKKKEETHSGGRKVKKDDWDDEDDDDDEC